jgi:primosomal protein N' (replication factor Y)
VELGVLRVELLEVDRVADSSATTDTQISLSASQMAALQSIKSGWERHSVSLFHGVTGSGKTLLYITLIREALTSGKTALLLLPEIALTTQIVARLRAYFGEELGVYHSRFSDNERVEIWRKVRDGRYKVILGARSALWLPFGDLQYIIVDEEHEPSYKQFEPAPRFHARDAAIYLASLHGAKVLLGSATPSLESSYNAQMGKYHYVPLKERYRNVAMPEVQIVPSKNIQAALSPILTTNLLEAITQTLAEGKQVILFQNKRGYAPFLICGVCGWVPTCKHCDVSLTYHKATDKLHCHYCGTRSTPMKHCPSCNNAHIASKSYGTEKVEEELQRIFPKVKTARMDLDSVRGKYKQSQLIDDFTRGKIDILVGTQMVVKGLDFEHVGLVGILSADSLLSYPDFRVNERGFQLMEQVSGRAGRMDGKGKVLIQAYNLKHPVLQWVIEHDYRSFFHKECAARQAFYYPPFYRVIKITCKHREEARASAAASLLANQLSTLQGVTLQGPAPALVARVRSYYLFELWLKIPKDAQFVQQVKDWLQQAIAFVMQQRGNSSLQIIPDVDPV